MCSTVIAFFWVGYMLLSKIDDYDIQSIYCIYVALHNYEMLNWSLENKILNKSAQVSHST